MTLRPMLAATVTDLATIRYPVYASPKLDGVRALITKNGVVSRTLKPIPNLYIQEQLRAPRLIGLDGELIIGAPTALDCIQRTVSGVMRKDYYLVPFTYHVFDCYLSDAPTKVRLRDVANLIDDLDIADKIKVVPQRLLANVEALLKYRDKITKMGFEGVILRGPESTYKYGRSTLKEQSLLKLKAFADSEAEVIDIVEQQYNANVATVDNLGLKKRSSHKANKTGLATMGALVVKDLLTRVEFEVGTGYTAAQRQEIWDTWPASKSLILKYKYFPIGVKDKPRHPVFLCFRDRIDM